MNVLDESIHLDNRLLRAKYEVISRFYDILDYPWERQYRKWRPLLLEDVCGEVIEVGVGTGRNLSYYGTDVNLLGIDLSSPMLARAEKRSCDSVCKIELRQEDATLMSSVPSTHFDWLISTFMCCVMPDHLQTLAIRQFERVLKPGGRFRLLELVYSKNPKLRRRQDLFAPLVEKLYGGRFDRNTLAHLTHSSKLWVTNTRFIKADVYLLIEGERIP